MQERSSTPSIGNIVAFAAVVAIALVFPLVWHHFNPQPPAPNAPAAVNDQKKEDKGGDQKKADADKAAAQKQPKPSDDPVDQTAKADHDKAKPAIAKPAAPDDDDRRWITMGSVAPDLKANPYRILITLDRHGGSLARLELSSERYRDLDDRSGYLGHLVMDQSDKGPGCLVQVVGAGTPAALADLNVGDRVVGVTYRGKSTKIVASSDDEEKSDAAPKHFETVMRQTKPGESIDLTIRRGKEEIKKTVELIRRPLEVIRPELLKPDMEWKRSGPFDATRLSANCPESFLTTLQQIDDSKLRLDEDPNAKFQEERDRELPGVQLRDAMWKIESPKKGDAASPVAKVVFSCEVPEQRLKIIKTYELQESETKAEGRGYAFVLSVAIENLDTKKHDVAFRLDGPNGLPTEGSWYVSGKVSRKWFTLEGLRDVVYKLADSEVGVVTCSELCQKGETEPKFRKDIGESSEFDAHRPRFFGIDAQYFSVAMLPDAEATAPNIERAVALRVGDIAMERQTLTNTSLRLISKPFTIEPGATSPAQRYEVFAGPKQPDLLRTWAGGDEQNLARHDLSGVIYYGWPIFRWPAEILTRVLEVFYSLVRSYGLAIIMLTVVVRLAMHPMSRKQALNAQMMQKLQPEMKAIQAKFKKDPEAARKAQQELFAKHNYNPLGGCLVLFIQMPIFLGLYRALQVDVELRDAPLISHAVRWCSNLAGPDMLWDWSALMPNTVNNGIGFPGIPLIGSALGLGPYLNLFPIITIVLYLIQQKVMMPPALDEQAQAQQKMMKYMMIFFGLMFYKIAAGLCIYFIASTLWGLAERQFLPKTATAGGDGDMATLEKPKPPSKPRLTDAEREAIRRQKMKR